MAKKSKQSQKNEVEETVEQTSVEQTEVEQTFETLYNSMLEQIGETYNTIRTVKGNLKLLERFHRREIKMSRKNRKSHNANKGQKKPSGFNKPGPVPQPIIDLLNLEDGIDLPRTKVTKLIYSYIKEHNLQVPEDKRTINPNKALRNLFGLEKNEQISFYNIQTHIKKLYPTKTVETIKEEEPIKEKISKKKSKKSKTANTFA